jgi:Ala-tRNA(Pro) deacylase
LGPCPVAVQVAAYTRSQLMHALSRAPSPMPHSPKEHLFEKLAELGIATRTVEHEATFTVAESRQLDRVLPGGHTKNLFLKDAKGQLFLIVVHAETEVDLKGLPKRIHCARLSFGKGDLLARVLGVEPGSVTAFAVLNDAEDQAVQLIFDQALMAFEVINCHPMTNTATTSIARDDLFRFFEATGHTPLIVDLQRQVPAMRETVRPD